MLAHAMLSGHLRSLSALLSIYSLLPVTTSTPSSSFSGCGPRVNKLQCCNKEPGLAAAIVVEAGPSTIGITSGRTSYYRANYWPGQMMAGMTSFGLLSWHNAAEQRTAL